MYIFFQKLSTTYSRSVVYIVQTNIRDGKNVTNEYMGIVQKVAASGVALEYISISSEAHAKTAIKIRQNHSLALSR